MIAESQIHRPSAGSHRPLADGSPLTPAGRRDAARRVYDAEWALHVAHQSQVDAWVAAAAEKLHQALVDYLAD